MKLSKVLVLAAAFFANQSFADTIDLGAATGYNAFIFGDYTASGNSVAGAIAAGGNVSLKSHSIANSGNNGYGLVVGGDLHTYNGGSLNGNAWVGGTYYANQQFSPTGSVYGSSVSAPVDFVAAKASLTALSTQLANISATGSYAGLDQWNQSSKVFTGSGATVEFFSLDASEFASFNNLYFNSIATGTTLIFNVSGENVVFGWQWQALSNHYNVLFNLYEAETVKINSTGVSMNILAVNADVQPGYGNLNGTIIADSWNKSVTLGNGTFASVDSPLYVAAPVPEPRSYALMIIGIIMMLFVRRYGKVKMSRQ